MLPEDLRVRQGVQEGRQGLWDWEIEGQERH